MNKTISTLLFAFSTTAFYSASAHADSSLTNSVEITNGCQQIFHDYVDQFHGKQLQRRALELYLSDSCTPLSRTSLPEATPQNIPSLSTPNHLKLLQIQDADRHIVTYRT